ncbi:MAG: tRNA-dihydrouridine synthase family protein [Anaerolineales bacterium]
MVSEQNSIKIGPLQVEGDLILAPMDGYTSWPFRSLCRELGSAISYTEFIKAGDVLDRPDYIQSKVQFTESERPVFFQVYGNDPQAILQAAQELVRLEPDGIDVNMGCPNRSIAGRGAGAGLMRTPLVAARIIKELSAELAIPVTAKIRTGWKDCQNAALLAGIIERFGGKLVAVHARSKEMGHEGSPDLAALAEIKSRLKIPVLGNGGIKKVRDIQVMKEATGCDGVMIGRAALTNPWIFSRRDREEISPLEVKELLEEHLERSLSFYGEDDGLVLFRKFAAAYLEPYSLEDDRRKDLLTERDPYEFKDKVNRIFSDLR